MLRCLLAGLGSLGLAVGWFEAASGRQDQAVCGPTDVVFVIDDTGSMSGAIINVQREVVQLLDRIDDVSGGRFRLGLVTFKDSVDVHHDLDARPTPALKKAVVRAAILGLFASGGDEMAEASDEALNTVINRLRAAGRPQSGDFDGAFTGQTNIIILITDNLPGGFDGSYMPGVDDLNAATRAQEAAAAGIKISAIYVPTTPFPDLRVTTIMTEYAAITGGLFVVTGYKGAGTASAIAEILEVCGSMVIAALETRSRNPA
ncbi:MAG: vWA domain-containing protein [Alphaproteobacteria bacterium]